MKARTDEALQSGAAFKMVIDNQRHFALSQDAFAQRAKEQRSVVAMQNVKEVNELIKERKVLQIEAYRLTQRFKLQVNLMVQKDVEDIFSKTMRKKEFR